MAHSSKNISLSEYLEDVNNGNILVPQFQRDFIWTKAKMLKLASSLLKGYPIGSFLLMQDSGGYASTLINSVEDSSACDSGNRLLILDGQQRTTTAYQIFYGRGKLKFYFNYKQFIEDVRDESNETIKTVIEDKIEDWLIAIPVEKAINSPDEQRTKSYFPLDIILNGSNNQDYSLWLDIYSTSNSLDNNYQLNLEKTTMLSKCKSFFIREIIKSITSYQASEIIIDKNTSPNIVCTIFETINSTGQKLTIFDLLNAKCFPSGFILRQELEKAFENYDIFNDYDYDNKDSLIGISLIKTIGLLCKKSCKKSDLLNLSSDEIREYWDKSIEYISIALEYMRLNFGVLGIGYFPYKDILPVIAVIINNDLFINNNNECQKKLDKWYWYTIFTGYFDNATDSKTIKTIKEFLGSDKDKGWFDDDNLIPEVIRTNQLNNFDGLDTLTSTQSAQYKAVINLLTLNGIQNFSFNRTEISKFKEKQLNDHHIYPKKFLSHFKINGDKANTILNRTLISQEVNDKIKDMPPFEYLKANSIVGNEFSTQELIKHCIQKGSITDTFTKDSYEDFKLERKKLIIELIKQHL